MRYKALLSLIVIALAVGSCRRKNRDADNADNGDNGDNNAAVVVHAGFQPASWLNGATRVVAVADHGGAPLIIAGGTGWLKSFRQDGTLVASVKGVGVPQQMELIDVHGDAAPELLVGWGRGRGAMAAPARVIIYSLAKLEASTEHIPMIKTSRADIRGIVGAGTKGTLYVAVFDSKYMVTVVLAKRSDDGSWTASEVTRARVVLGLSAADVDGDGTTELFLARPYGDRKDEPGMVVRVDGASSKRLPSERGARAVLALPGAVIIADGWHRNYGRFAKGQISRVTHRDGRWHRTVLALVPKRHGYARLRAGDTNGDGAADIIAVGDGPVVVVPLAGGPVSKLTDESKRVADAYPIDLNGDGADELVIAGESAGIWSGGSPQR